MTVCCNLHAVTTHLLYEEILTGQYFLPSPGKLCYTFGPYINAVQHIIYCSAVMCYTCQIYMEVPGLIKASRRKLPAFLIDFAELIQKGNISENDKFTFDSVDENL